MAKEIKFTLEDAQVGQFLKLLKKAQAYDDEYFSSDDIKKDNALIDIIMIQSGLKEKNKRRLRHGI